MSPVLRHIFKTSFTITIFYSCFQQDEVVEYSSSMMSLWLFNAARWRAVQLFSFQTLNLSKYYNIIQTLPVSNYYLTYWKICKIQLYVVCGWCWCNRLITLSHFPQNELAVATKYNFLMIILQLVIITQFKELLDNFCWVICCNVI